MSLLTSKSFNINVAVIIVHFQQPDQSDIQVPPKEKKFRGYFKIARHYGWALNQTFNFFNFNNVIIIEGNLVIEYSLV